MRNSVAPNQLEAFAVTAPGLEPLAARELAALGIHGKVQDGGVAWRGDWDSMARANLWLRTASRVLVRVAEFRATAFFELELNAKRIPWQRFVPAGASVEFRVTCRKSKLYHSDAVAQRLATAVTKAVPGVQIASGDSPANDDDDASGIPTPTPDAATHILFVVRFFHDLATISVDSSGAPLHRRGYRQQLAKAPLRETLAAAMLLAAGWDGTTPLLDPMCGSGTIPIEAARLARRIAPGRDRDFAFSHWPESASDAKRARWTALLDEARRGELPAAPISISGSDRDAGAIAAARANAERAGVSADVDFSVRAISAIPPDASPGLVVSNPPYGVRVGNPTALRDLYAQLGNVLRANRPQARLALLSADKQLERQLRMPLEEAFATRNGGIPVHCVIGRGERGG